MESEVEHLLNYSPAVPRQRYRRLALRFALIACAPDVLMWTAVFIHHRLAFNNAFSAPFLIAYFVSWVAAIVGIIIAIRSGRSSRWSALTIFGAVALLNIYGFFWCIGAAVSAIE